MWKYLVLNGLWLLILLLVQFFGSTVDQLVIFASIIVMAVFLALKSGMDPIAWSYYVLFSFFFFYGTRYFRAWSYGGLTQLREESVSALDRFSAVEASLKKKMEQTLFLEERADEIVEFYEQIKELSKSLDHLETFLIFAEALAENFEFKIVKIAFFGEKHGESVHPEELYELRGEEMKGNFDRSLYLKDRKKCRTEVFPFDQKVYGAIFGENPSVWIQKSKEFVAYPIRIHERIFAVLIIVGVQTHEDPLFSILIERFISELQRVKLYESIQKLAITDGLTGVFVRQHLMDRLEGEVDRSKRFHLKLTFLMIDIDFFKQVNDEYGHLVGDVVLRQVAHSIKKSVREVDFVGRYGGEEFGVCLIETDEGTAFLIAERIRRSIHEKIFKAYDEELKVTVSIGSATLNDVVHGAQAVVDAADEALYQAKRMGRNRVCMAASDS